MITGNEPAMPTIEQTGNPQCWNTVAGITIRQHFAAMALQGLCANSVPGQHHEFSYLVKEAVIYADSLIAELNKTTTP